MATVWQRWTHPRIVLKGMLLGIVLLTVASLPFLGIAAIAIPVILVPFWIACVLLLAYHAGRWSPGRGLTRSPKNMPARPRPRGTYDASYNGWRPVTIEQFLAALMLWRRS